MNVSYSSSYRPYVSYLTWNLYTCSQYAKPRHILPTIVLCNTLLFLAPNHIPPTTALCNTSDPGRAPTAALARAGAAVQCDLSVVHNIMNRRET